MADVTITATGVLKSSAASVQTDEGIAGGTITAGMPIYKDTTASNVLKAADASALATAVVCGIALNGGATGQTIEYVTRDPALVAGGTLAVGTIYVLSATAGGICPEADILTGEFITILGVANTTTTLNFSAGSNMRASIAHA
tara:strand:- start:82 stop:510 length:429 start_codon:yes stop_codon:yes gene_type:complete